MVGIEGTKELIKDIEKSYGIWFKGYLKVFLSRASQWIFLFLCGYYNVSFGWLVAPLFFMVLRDKRAKEKKVKFDIVRSIANSDEKEIIQEIQKFSNLPSWVTFPDMERAEWVNKIMKKVWPYAGQYCKDLCQETIEPAIRLALKEYKLSGFKFEKIILGDTPARISGIKVYDQTARNEIIMDADFVYAGDCKFEVSFSKFKAGIKDLQVSGRVRVLMKPLVRQIPLVGGVQVFFLNNPEVDFNLIGIADVFDMPGLSDLLRSIVIDQIANIMVLPNRFPIQLVENIDIVELQAPLPAGVLRIQVIEAKNLMKKDFSVIGKGKSDPYCIIRLGAQKFKTKTINNTVKPVWNYCCEALCDVILKQHINIECWDWDDMPGTKYGDFLGRANLDVQSIFSSGEVDMWLPLSDAKSGRIHVKATWIELSNNPDDLKKHLEEVSDLQNMTENPLHSALLAVWVDSASKLNPPSKNIPDPFVRLHVANKKQETVAQVRTNDPIFEEGFKFLVRNPNSQELLVEVIDQKTNKLQGLYELDLNTMLTKNNMEIHDSFPLQKSTGGHASIKMNITLKVFHSMPPNDLTSLEENNVLKYSQEKESPAEEIKILTMATTTPDLEQPKPVIHSEKPKPQIEADSSEMVPLLESEIMAKSPRKKSTGGEFGLGRIRLTLTYELKDILSVIVHEVQNLPKEEDGEIPDPYVKVYLLPDRSKDSKRKTNVIKDNCNPIYDQKFEYVVESSEMAEKKLQFSVINKKGFFHMQKSDIMGQVHIECKSLDANLKMEWYDLMPAEDESED